MNFGTFFGGRGAQGDDCCCSIVWLLFLLSVCGNGFGCGSHGDNDCCMLIILLLLLGNCGCGSGCRG